MKSCDLYASMRNDDSRSCLKKFAKSTGMPQTLDDQRQNPYSFDGSAASTRSGILPDDTVYWIPTEGATLHNGKSIPANMLFPFLPHEEIGEVDSAYSNFDSRKFFGFNRKLYQRFYKIIFFLSIFGLQVLVHFTRAIGLKNYLISVGILAFTIVFLYALRWVKPPPECSYVGLNGYLRWYRHKKVFYHEIVLFKDCSHNRFERVIAENRGTYHGAQVFGLTARDGTRHEYETHLSFDAIGPYDMGLSIDLAWTKFFLRGARERLSAGSYVDILAGKNIVVRFYADRIEIITDLQRINVVKRDIRLFRFAYDGNIKIFIRSELNPDNQGLYLLPLTEIQNYRAFLLLFRHIFDLQLEGRKVELLPTWHLGTW